MSGGHDRRSTRYRNASSVVKNIKRNRLRRRHKFKSLAHRSILIKRLFHAAETHTTAVTGQLHFPKYRFNSDIPEKYNETYVCTLPVNPGNFFTYWEYIPDEPARDDSKSRNDDKLILRFKKADPIFFDIEQEPENSIVDDKGTITTESTDGGDQLFSILDISTENTVGTTFTKIPEVEEFYNVELLHTTEAGEEILIVSCPSIQGIPGDTENNFICLLTSDDTIDYFDYSDNPEKKEPTDDCSTPEYDRGSVQYLGSAAIDIKQRKSKHE